MKETTLRLFSAGDCPVCASSGVLALLVSVTNQSALYVCPMCGVAWSTPPQPHTVDEIVPIEDAAPDGLRFPTDAEIEAVRAQGVDLVETDVDDWRDDLAPHLADHRRQATPILATTTFIALTLGFAALLVPLNEYDAMGIEGAYDCDGPLEVGLFLVPALLSCVVTLVSAVIVLRRAERTSTVVPTCGALVLLLLTLLVPKAVRLYQESERNSAPGSPCS